MSNLNMLELGVLIAVLFLFGAPPAHAYVDASTGSYFFQLALGSALSLWFSVKSALARKKSR